MIIDIMLLAMIALFGLWVINKHYNNAGDIEVIIKQMASTISDMRKMQEDLIQFRQDLINVDSKYRIKDEWVISRLKQLTDIVSSLSDSHYKGGQVYNFDKRSWEDYQKDIGQNEIEEIEPMKQIDPSDV